jgi:hypothetical protein
VCDPAVHYTVEDDPSMSDFHGGESADLQTLRAMVEAGADLSKATETIFYLYFPNEEQARRVASYCESEGYAAEVGEPLEGYTEWLCRLTRQMVPSRDIMEARARRLQALAIEFEGEFDGWEPAILPWTPAAPTVRGLTSGRRGCRAAHCFSHVSSVRGPAPLSFGR